MFMGEYQHSVDEKGRLIVPAKFRDTLGEKFVVTKGLDNCLFVYPQAEWSNLEAKLKALPLTSANARAFARFMFSGATEVEVDKQGRINLPQNLRDHAKLDRDVLVIGVNTRAEIWAVEEWKAYQDKAGESYEEIAEKIVDLGI